MLLAREFIGYLSRQVVQRLTPRVIETGDPRLAAEHIEYLIEDDLSIEDKLNDEVRDILDKHSEQIKRDALSYQEMFKKIKNTLIQQRKVIRASGRDSADGMKLSRDKVNDLSHKIVAMMRSKRDYRVKGDPNGVRLEVLKAITEILQVEEKADKAARTKIRTQKRDIPEGAEEWDLLHRRYYAEELKKLGIELSH